MTHTTMAVDITAITDRNATVASAELIDVCAPEFSVTMPSVVASSTGSAKREPGDVHDPEIAYLLAAGRALENLGRQMKRRGEAKVRAASQAAEEKLARFEERRNKKTEPAVRTFNAYGDALLHLLQSYGYVVEEYDDDGHRAF